MRRIPPWAIIALGFVCVLVGVAVPFLMVIRVIEPSFALGFLSYALSTAGLFLGLIGLAWHRPTRGE